MRNFFLSLAFLLGATTAALAQTSPTVLSRSAVAPHDADGSFKLLKDYFAEPANRGFTIVRTDAPTHTIVAKRSGINTDTWQQWAYCKVSTTHLLDTLQDGAVTVTAKASPGGNNSSLVTVTADFVGTYALASQTSAISCYSNGVLERDILTAAGASPPPPPSPAL